ncbi:DNA glycosylase/AP lyase ROS1 [Euphorbia peplus]|nr:DNA glycosylase/AP lyase ROS1 [Euphorbia peplus]
MLLLQYLNPIDVPRSWIWNLPRRTVYFGTSLPTIFKGLTTESFQQCFWRGYVCVRGFDQKTRAPRPLLARLHFPARILKQEKGRMSSGDAPMLIIKNDRGKFQKSSF